MPDRPTASDERIVIAVDAMGGDHAPAAIVRGAVRAAADRSLDIVLVGRGSEIRSLLPWPDTPLRIVEASEAIAMDAQPTQVRQMRDSSIMVGLGLIKSGEADAFLSFGNTGAVMAGSLLRLGRIPGVDRPALGALFRNGRGTTSLLLDVGANAVVRPQSLAQFATMGKAYFERVLKHRNPSVGLLNVGEESGKGHPVVQVAHELLTRQEPNFVGNIEGRGLVAGEADVVVTDGFTGNIIVKLTEGLVAQLMLELRREAKTKLTHMAGAWMMKGAFEGLREHWDYAKVGSAPLFGIDGAVLVGHGRADAEAVASGIQSAKNVVAARVVQSISEAVAGTATDDPEPPAESRATPEESSVRHSRSR